ncbi:Octopamine receptor [Trichinella spiralis]|uniref:Octopamine receptor n=1 Tax=Trichinella spiralis TaxID=6334 RepID=A0ABR3KCC1_TRISP
MHWLTLVWVIVLAVMCLFAIIGNGLIILSVSVYRGMQTTPNILLVSLATADFLVSILVMPVALIDMAFKHTWQFGRLICRLWSTAHVLLCTASILNLCIIGLDRYFAITDPLKYKGRQTRRLAITALLFVWCIALLISSLPLVIPAWEFPDQLDSCTYPTMLSYRIYSSMASFYIPLMLILFVYCKIVRVIRCRLRTIDSLNSECNRLSEVKPLQHALIEQSLSEKSQSVVLSSDNSNRTSLGNAQRPSNSPADGFSGCIIFGSFFTVLSWTQSTLQLLSPNGSGRARRVCKAQPKGRTIRSFSTIATNTTTGPFMSEARIAKPLKTSSSFCQTNQQSRKAFAVISNNRHSHDSGGPEAGRRFHSFSGLFNNEISITRRLFASSLQAKERRAIVVVCIVVSGFTVCWLPFFTLHLIEPICHAHPGVGKLKENLAENFQVPSTLSVSENLYETSGAKFSCPISPALSDAFLWLGYFNSLVNPLIYCFCNQDFRRCFKDIVLCKCRRKSGTRRLSMRHLYQSRD